MLPGELGGWGTAGPAAGPAAGAKARAMQRPCFTLAVSWTSRVATVPPLRRSRISMSAGSDPGHASRRGGAGAEGAVAGGGEPAGATTGRQKL